MLPREDIIHSSLQLIQTRLKIQGTVTINNTTHCLMVRPSVCQYNQVAIKLSQFSQVPKGQDNNRAISYNLNCSQLYSQPISALDIALPLASNFPILYSQLASQQLISTIMLLAIYSYSLVNLIKVRNIQGHSNLIV